MANKNSYTNNSNTINSNVNNNKNQNYNFDIISVSFSDYTTDARTMNLLNTLSDLGNKICLICFAEFEKPFYYNENILIVPVPVSIFNNHKTKSYQKLLEFNAYINQTYFKYLNSNPLNILGKPKFIDFNNINPGFIVANDLYALPIARKLKLLVKANQRKLKDKTKKQAKLIYDSREVYSEIGSLHNRNLRQKLLTIFEKYLVKSVDTIITSGELDTEFLIGHFAARKYKKIEYYEIYNYPPIVDITEVRNEFLLHEKYNIPLNKKIIIYQGKIMNGRGIKYAIEVIKHFEDYHLCLIGDGELTEKYKKLAKKLNVDSKVTFCGSVPYEKLLEYTQSAYVGLCLFEPISTSYKFALPNKLFEYAMSELPVIATELPAIKKVISNYNFGILINNTLEIDELKTALEVMLSKDLYTNFLKQSKLAKLEFNYQNQIHTIKNIFSK